MSTSRNTFSKPPNSQTNGFLYSYRFTTLPAMLKIAKWPRTRSITLNSRFVHLLLLSGLTPARGPALSVAYSAGARSALMRMRTRVRTYWVRPSLAWLDPSLAEPRLLTGR